MARYVLGVMMLFQVAAPTALARDESDQAGAVEVVEIDTPAPQLNPGVEAFLDCISWYESRHNPSALNRSSGAAGQFQFLYSTWLTTPEGKAGLSRYDPVAARSAARWMVAQGRSREWVPVRLGWC